MLSASFRRRPLARHVGSRVALLREPARDGEAGRPPEFPPRAAAVAGEATERRRSLRGAAFLLQRYNQGAPPAFCSASGSTLWKDR